MITLGKKQSGSEGQKKNKVEHIYMVEKNILSLKLAQNYETCAVSYS
jgi:hypothetical protein